MKYGISKIVGGFDGFIELDEDEYEQIKNARKYLFEALFIEEKFDLVTENYLEFENELLSLASRFMIFQNADYFSMSVDRNLIGRRIVNLLSAAKMYVDQFVQHIEKMYGVDAEIFKLIKKEAANQYDQSLGYRAMEALRNFVQHRDVPIQQIKFFAGREKGNLSNQINYIVIPMISISTLEEDGKFKKSVLEELKATCSDGWVDLRPLIREYLEGLGRIQGKIRELTHSDLAAWEEILDKTIEKFKNEFGKEVSLTGLAIVTLNNEGCKDEYKTIFKEFVDKRMALQTKNGNFANIHACYASNQIKVKDKI